jgi:carbamoyl-phosphate synthase large subunit
MSHPSTQPSDSPTLNAGSEFNILFTCAGRRVEILQAFRNAMTAAGVSGQIITTEADDYFATKSVADASFRVPLVRDEGYLSAFLDIIKTNNIRMVVPLTDLDILLLAQNEPLLKTMGCTPAVGTPQSVTTCRDKHLFASALASQGIPTIPTQDVPTFQAAPYYPCFAKPLSGSSSIGAEKLDSPEQLQQHINAFGEDLVLRPFIDGQEFAFDFYKSRAGEVKIVVPRLRLRVHSGEVEQGITVDDPALIQAARGLGEALEGLWGVFCAQCRRTTDGEILFYEVKPRFGGGAPLSIAANANLPLYLIQDVRGQDISTDGTFEPNLMMMRYPASKYAQVNDPKSLPGFDTPLSL